VTASSVMLPPNKKGGGMSRHLNNQLLARLEPATLNALAPYLAVTRLEQGRVLSETHSVIDKVYFPHGGIVSCVVELIGGGAIETGMIGKDGQFGAGPALDHRVSLNHVVVQVPGDVSIMDGIRFRQLVEQHPPLRTLAVAYENFMTAQVQQTSACNAVHKVPERICKWLLRMHRLVGDELPLTQEFLAQMMGVRRTSVTQVAVELQRAGMISYHRGRIRIINLARIEHSACECNAAVSAHYERVFE
jgi:CRP-like cAMP-binding protein